LCSKPLTTMRNIEHLLILSLGFTNIAFAQNTRDYDDYRLIAPDFESFDIGNENLTDAVQVQAEHSGDSEDLVIETGEDDKSEMLAYRDTCLYRGRIGREGFLCDSGDCVDRGRVCDGQPACQDGSDETQDCCASRCLTPSGLKVCLPADGYNSSSLAGTDCRLCSIGGYPGYRCDSGQCIFRRKVCDGKAQCADNSDEKYCAHHLCRAGENVVPVPRDLLDPAGDCRRCDYHGRGDGFRCNSARCILASWVCDGSPDCPDGSDELRSVCSPTATTARVPVPAPAQVPTSAPVLAPSPASLFPTEETEDLPGQKVQAYSQTPIMSSKQKGKAVQRSGSVSSTAAAALLTVLLSLVVCSRI